MWAVAEQRDAEAIEEFGARFPDLKGELIKRVTMVNGLRGTMRTSDKLRDIPAFQPRTIRPAPQRVGRLAMAAGLAVLAAIGFATYSVTVYLTRPPVEQPPGRVAEVSTSRVGPDEELVPEIKANPPAHPPFNGGSAGGSQAPRQTPAVEPHMKPFSIRIERAPLLTVIEMVASQCGLSVEVAPGMPNPEVEAQYDNMAGLDMLRDMGSRFGFTVFPQGQNKVLIIPAIDSGRGLS